LQVFRKRNISNSEIIEWLKELRKNSYIPESNFAVSSIFRISAYGYNDYYFAGVNVENIDHRLSTHSEEGAISAMVTAFGKAGEILEGWVMGAAKDDVTSESMVTCCGKCRQHIAGFAKENVKIHSVALNGDISTTTVGEFLPKAFTFREYIEEITNSIESITPSLSNGNIENKLIRCGNLSDKDIFEWLDNLESIDYVSKISQSIILKLDNGFYVAGTNIEEIAFVSISAAQNAVAISSVEFGDISIEKIWVYTKGREGKEIAADSFASLPMSSLQVLISMAVKEDIPISFFSSDATMVETSLIESAKILSTSNKRLHKNATWQKHS